MLSKATQLVPIAPLKRDLSVLRAEEATSSQSRWIFPLQDGPLAIFNDVADAASHVRPGKLRVEHPDAAGRTKLPVVFPQGRGPCPHETGWLVALFGAGYEYRE